MKYDELLHLPVHSMPCVSHSTLRNEISGLVRTGLRSLRCETVREMVSESPKKNLPLRVGNSNLIEISVLGTGSWYQLVANALDFRARFVGRKGDSQDL